MDDEGWVPISLIAGFPKVSFCLLKSQILLFFLINLVCNANQCEYLLRSKLNVWTSLSALLPTCIDCCLISYRTFWYQ